MRTATRAREHDPKDSSPGERAAGDRGPSLVAPASGVGFVDRGEVAGGTFRPEPAPPAGTGGVVQMFRRAGESSFDRSDDGGVVPLPMAVRREGEARLGIDLSSVKIHPNSSQAVSLGAYAFARGDSVHFRPGALASDRLTGHTVLRHELGHVAQQRAGEVPVTGTIAGIPVNTDPALEQRADEVAAGRSIAASPTSPGAAGGEAPAQLFLYQGQNLDAKSQPGDDLRRVLREWHDGDIILTPPDLHEIVKALQTKGGVAGLDLRIVEALYHADSLEAIPEDDEEQQEAPVEVVNPPAQEHGVEHGPQPVEDHGVAPAHQLEAEPDNRPAPPESMLRKIRRVVVNFFERIGSSLDAIDFAGAAAAAAGAAGKMKWIETTSPYFGPFGMGLAAIFSGKAAMQAKEAFDRAAIARSVSETVNAGPLKEAIDYAAAMSHKRCILLVVEAVINLVSAVFGAATVASLGWASPALLVSIACSFLAKGYAWIVNKLEKGRRENHVRTLVGQIASDPVVALVGDSGWGLFTDAQLRNPTQEIREQFAEKVGNKMMRR